MLRSHAVSTGFGSTLDTGMMLVASRPLLEEPPGTVDVLRAGDDATSW